MTRCLRLGRAWAALAMTPILFMSQGASGQALPLLDQTALRSPLMAGCDGKPDSAPLPVDPRALVKQGVNTNPNGAVQFNAYFVNLHNPPPPFVNRLPPRPTTCGQFRASATRGRINLQERQFFQPMALAISYHFVYQQWGYLVRPPDFEEQVAKRYGLYPAPFRNPYPLPGEDPNTSNGGTGQLPLGLIQGKDDNGRWTGLIGASCSACHDSRLGTTTEASFKWGLPNSANDPGLLASDLFRTTPITTLGNLLPIPWSNGRGSSDAIGLISLLPALFDMESLTLAPSLLEYVADSPHAGMTKAPAWWARAYKTRQFWDGSLSSDNVHSEMAFGVANIFRDATGRRNLEDEFEDINNFLISLSPATYPKTINTSLAEQGAVIYHERDLWAGSVNAAIPRPAGNGSCASCHGVYSPRHAADPNYLPDPRLKGVAAVVTPIETIRTDPQRMQLMADERQRRAWNSGWWAYNNLSPDWTGYASDNIVESELRRVPRAIYNNGGPIYSPLGPNIWEDPIGYIAPPLYGAWATAPYFHNGSVPNLWGVLKPADRPKVWKRPYTATGIGGKNAGYDYGFASYDWQKLGWKYTAVNCSNNIFTSPFLPCSAGMSTVDILYSMWDNVAAQYLNLAYQTPPPVTDQQIKSRMVYNSYLYGNGNGGHDFTQSLTDSERWALIEYIKTL
jgi:mono/diheme cytochrome c family protein